MKVWILFQNSSGHPYGAYWEVRGVFDHYPDNDHSDAADADNWTVDEWQVEEADAAGDANDRR